MARQNLIFIALCISLPQICFATSYYGANFSYAAYAKEPDSLRGSQLMLNYAPERFHWHPWSIYFDGGFSHFGVTRTYYYTTVNIYSIAPVLRYSFERYGIFSPYFELSIGFCYLNHTHIDNRNLGIHFAFQDRMGFGTFLGTSRNLSLGIHAVHYSNAHLSAHNSGITVPLALDLGYRFCS